MHEPAWMQSQPAKFNPIPCYKPKETFEQSSTTHGKTPALFFRSFSHRCFFLGASFPLGLWTRAGPEGWSPIQSSAKGLSPCRPNGEQALFVNVTSLSWIFKYLGKLVKQPDLKKLGLETLISTRHHVIDIISIIVITTTLTWKKESGQPATPEVLFVVVRWLLPRQSCNYALIPRLASFQEACPPNLLKQRDAGEQLQDF